MDNASKALIMAGAILIAVMLISLGVLLYNRAAGVAEESIGTIDSIGVTAFNEQFTQYCGSNVKGSTVKTLVNKAQASVKAGHTVTVYNGSTGSTPLKAADVDTTSTYTVEDAEYEDGVIKTIRVY